MNGPDINQPDLSHLNEEERQMILKVMQRHNEEISNANNSKKNVTLANNNTRGKNQSMVNNNFSRSLETLGNNNNNRNFNNSNNQVPNQGTPQEARGRDFNTNKNNFSQNIHPKDRRSSSQIPERSPRATSCDPVGSNRLSLSNQGGSTGGGLNSVGGSVLNLAKNAVASTTNVAKNVTSFGTDLAASGLANAGNFAATAVENVGNLDATQSLKQTAAAATASAAGVLSKSGSHISGSSTENEGLGGTGRKLCAICREVTLIANSGNLCKFCGKRYCSRCTFSVPVINLASRGEIRMGGKENLVRITLNINLMTPKKNSSSAKSAPKSETTKFPTVQPPTYELSKNPTAKTT